MPKLASIEHPTEVLIREARALLKPTPVRLHHFPGWMAAATKTVAADLGIRHPIVTRDDQLRRLEKCLKKLGGDDCDWLGSLDHWGSWQTDTREGFCGEPYGVPAVDHMAWSRFAAMAGLTLHLTANSWWFPGSTIRIGVYREREGRSA